MASRNLRAAVLGATAALCAALPAGALADTVVPDDQIVQGSICAGSPCVNNESFGFDTVRLKALDTRIGFQDTSTGAFPSTDWELAANDLDSTGASGQNYFAIRDTTDGTTPLRVMAGAPNDALKVNPDGSVSLSSGPLVSRVDGTTTTNATPADAAALLTALRALPVSTYELTADPAHAKHVGPTAADFSSAFGLGSASAIAPADEAGVALAVARELSARLAALTGPAGAAGAKGADGAAGAKGADGASVTAATATLKAAATKLSKLEKAQAKLTKRNTALIKQVKALEQRLRAAKGSK